MKEGGPAFEGDMRKPEYSSGQCVYTCTPSSFWKSLAGRKRCWNFVVGSCGGKDPKGWMEK